MVFPFLWNSCPNAYVCCEHNSLAYYIFKFLLIQWNMPLPLYRSDKRRIFLLYNFSLNGILMDGFPQMNLFSMLMLTFVLKILYHFSYANITLFQNGFLVLVLSSLW